MLCEPSVVLMRPMGVLRGGALTWLAGMHAFVTLQMASRCTRRSSTPRCASRTWSTT